MKRFNTSDDASKADSRTKLVSVFLLALCSLTFTTGISAADGELVVNGGFEAPNLALFPATSRAFSKGWTSFYGANKSDADPCTSHLRLPVNPALPFDPFSNPLVPATFGPSGNWEVECNGDTKIPGWSMWWSDSVAQDPVTGDFLFNPATDQIGRIEIQNNIYPTWSNPFWVPQGKLPISFAKFGEQKAELDSHDRIDMLTGKPVINSNVALTQTLETCPNQKYVLTYEWRSRTTVAGDNDVRVQVGGLVARTHTLTGDWQKEIVNFVSGNNPTQIAFISIGDGTTKGMSLDGVSVIGPVRDLLGECPPPPSCEADDGSSDDGSSDDGSSDDGSSDDGSSDDGSSDDLQLCTDDESSDDGSSDDGSSDDGSSDDGSSDDGSSDDDTSCLCANGKPDELTLLYDGDDFTSHNQGSGDSSVETFGILPTDANIRVTSKKGDLLFSGVVSVGQVFSFQQNNNITIEISDGTTLMQVVTFHASCSVPLELLDTFGGITIYDFN